MYLSIITPTYNRSEFLKRTYVSLCAQTNKSFEWIIIDDGSDDDTNERVGFWMEQDNGFPIHYYPLKHIGLPGAMNFGIKKVSTEWVMKLDSDDFLLPNAVDCVLEWIYDIKGLPNIGGVGFARCYPDGNYMKNQEPIIDDTLGYVDATHLERQLFNLDMDMCEVHRKSLLERYPFQCWPGESFAPEQLSFYEMALDGWKIRWHKNKLYVCDYLPQGLTRDNMLVLRNPMGFAMMYNQNMLIKPGMKNHWRDAVQMIALSFFAGHLSYLAKANDRIAIVLLFPLGVLLGIRRKYQLKNL